MDSILLLLGYRHGKKYLPSINETSLDACYTWEKLEPGTEANVYGISKLLGGGKLRLRISKQTGLRASWTCDIFWTCRFRIYSEIATSIKLRFLDLTARDIGRLHGFTLCTVISQVTFRMSF
jgi:hypothetical protein